MSNDTMGRDIWATGEELERVLEFRREITEIFDALQNGRRSNVIPFRPREKARRTDRRDNIPEAQ